MAFKILDQDFDFYTNAISVTGYNEPPITPNVSSSIVHSIVSTR